MKKTFKVQVRECAAGKPERTITCKAIDRERAINKALASLFCHRDASFVEEDRTVRQPHLTVAYGRPRWAARAANGIPKSTVYGPPIRVSVEIVHGRKVP